MTDTRHSAWRLSAYSLASIPLAMAALPIYVNVPKFYSTTIGLNLAAIGVFLLLARIFDAVQDPLLGDWSDRTRDTKYGRAIWMWLGAPLLAVGMWGLLNPPSLSATAMGWWLVGMLLVVYTAFSMLQISYQAIGAELSDDPIERARITGFREGFGLVGVFLAAALPQVLSDQFGAREGYAIFALTFAPTVLVLVALTLWLTPKPAGRTLPNARNTAVEPAPVIAPAPATNLDPAVVPSATTEMSVAALGSASIDEAAVKPTLPQSAFARMRLPLKNERFRKLLLVFIFSGIAASIPATLVLFYIQDVIAAPKMSAWFLIAYFAAGALGMPYWVWLSSRIGKERAWLVGMIVSIIAFVWAFLLTTGDTHEFLVICVLSGLGLGADLSLPPAILADLIDDDEKQGLGRREGAYFGLWNLVSKMNLALAAGIALPLLAWLGYQPGMENTGKSLKALAGTYALLPCLFKAAAAIALMQTHFLAASTGKKKA